LNVPCSPYFKYDPTNFVYEAIEVDTDGTLKASDAELRVIGFVSTAP